MGEHEIYVRQLMSMLFEGTLDVTAFVNEMTGMGWCVSSINYMGENRVNTITFCRPGKSVDEHGWPVLEWVTL